MKKLIKEFKKRRYCKFPLGGVFVSSWIDKKGCWIMAVNKK